jgi:gamma-glutamyltranspeptidase / glutathione hydrolase
VAQVEDALRLAPASSASGTADKCMVVGSTGPFAQLAGLKAMEAGGSAADAVVATALAQVALAAGAWVSCAGVFAMVHYQASTGQVDSLSAGFATFAGETDLATIPKAPQPSGRTALVPGFIAGIGAAHHRFGRLSWADLLTPAIYIAEHGFPVGRGRERQFERRKNVLSRTAEGREIFFGSRGRLPCRGETFRQPVFARTLRHIAAEGPEWMYRGPWAREFVDLVRREGGKASLEDLASYQPIWAEPVTADFHGHQVHALGEPGRGGPALALTLNLADRAGLADPAEDPESMYWMIQIARQVHPGGLGVTEYGPACADRLWREMLETGSATSAARPSQGSHSDFVIAVDCDGNVAAACHSINTSLWGSTGLFAGGISIPDVAGAPQFALARPAPGTHVTIPASPVIALRGGRPVLAAGSVGIAGNAVALQCLHAILGTGQDIAAASSTPLFHGPDFMTGDSVNTPAEDRSALAQRLSGSGPGSRLASAARRTRSAGVPAERRWAAMFAGIPQVVEDRFDPALLAAVEARGQPLRTRPVTDPLMPRGFWGGIVLSSTSPRLSGARTPLLDGQVKGI